MITDDKDEDKSMIYNMYEEREKTLSRRIKSRLKQIKSIGNISKKREIQRYTKRFHEKFGNFDNDLFYAVQIETFNRCNGECPFCPVNKHDDTRKAVKMTDELYHKIVDELADIEYSGKCSISSNNEPLLDQNIVEKVKYAREKLPKALLYIYTNGTLMTLEKCKELAKYLDRIYIDNYEDDLSLHDNIKPIAELCERDEELNQKVYICLRKVHEVLWTRGGQSPNNNQRKERTYPCFLPFGQLIIRPDGKVSLCCSDALGKYTLGDASENSLLDIWRGEQFNEIRRKVKEDITSIDLCRYCDAKHKD